MGQLLVPRKPPDPRESAPVGSYLTLCDKSARPRMVEVLQSDYAGVECADFVTGFIVEIERVELAQNWRRVRPEPDA
jgi:hypothetical protein